MGGLYAPLNQQQKRLVKPIKIMQRQMDVSQLNKRQYFAGLMLASLIKSDDENSDKADRELVRRAINLADILMEELSKEV